MKKFAVFDIDGTLIRWQLYHAAVDRLAKRGLLGPRVHEAIHQARMTWKRREHIESFRSYEQAVIEAYEAALPKLSVDDFQAIVEEIVSEYKDQVYRYTRQLTRDLKKKGYVLLAISGSHQELVEPVCQKYGFNDCVGTRYATKRGHFTGQRTFAAGDKAATLKELIAKHDLTLSGSYGVGDSQSDAVMLAMVENPIAFNPDRDLFATAKKQGWKVVIERKNVVYELTHGSSGYQLQ